MNTFHRRAKQLKNHAERGDTIVEVLIAVAIISLVLTAAYALTNRNVRSIQETQEQAYAQKIVQQQVELLRAASTKPTTDGCFSAAGTFVNTTNSACSITSGGSTYKLEIKRLGATSKYSIKASWDTLAGSSAAVTVYYQVVS